MVLVLIALLIVLPMLYVLSIGPASWLINSGRIDQSWIRAIHAAYWPLGWTAGNVPVIGPAIVSYAELWVSPQPTPTAAAVPAPAPSGL